ncbi:hypothetical protein M1O55_03585 [Dehalococcoidia bacterium]|nr:hypothetical protein [Dehalococcoidia bacterium]
MTSRNLEEILAALEQRGDVRRVGKGWETRCPAPDHEDAHPSFYLYPGGGGKCFSACSRYWSPRELAELLGIQLEDSGSGLTVAELAEAKGLPEEFLRSLGVTDGFTGTGDSRSPCVDIPYADESGEEKALRKRLSLDGSSRYRWRRGDHTTLYGLPFLKDIKKTGWVVLVEGESDAWTLWLHRIPALGLPGASTWKERFHLHLTGVEVYVWHEPDEGGDKLLHAVSQDLPDLRIIEAPPNAKDPSELYLLDSGSFNERMTGLIEAARPLSEIRTETFSTEARDCLTMARTLLHSPDVLAQLKDAISATGFAGDARPAMMSYFAITSRLLQDPLNVAYISQSSSGKNAGVDASLPFFPKAAFYLVRASSPRALIYNDEQFTHRTVILTEADSLPEDGSAASAIRSLMSDGEMTYEVVEKSDDGNHHVRKIVKQGPTGLITTSTRPLGDQASTRTLTVSISDSPEQTRMVMHAQADRANEAVVQPDFEPWIALQRWLDLAGERRVVIPFAHKLADMIPATAVRMRRDFSQLLTVIKTNALLHQTQRERDVQGRIIATLDDYAAARWLLEEVFTTTVNEVTPAIRQTVEAVTRLSKDGSTVTEQELVKELGLVKSTINYRVRRAVKSGFLVNQTSQRGAPAQLVVGGPVPNGCPLPTTEELSLCVEEKGNDSNPRTAPTDSAMAQVQKKGTSGVRTPFEPHSNRSSSLHSQAEAGFERFDGFSGDTTHTQSQDAGAADTLPWDSFLEEADSDETDAG